MARKSRLPARRRRIQTLFLQRLESYGLRETAQLLGVSTRELIREAEYDDRDAYRANGEWRFTWRQVACIALRRWSLSEIHEALGTDASTVLPPLLALRSVTVRLPEYIVRGLETVAADCKTTLDDCLLGELVDFAGAMPRRLKNRIRGFRRAYLFPGQE